MQHGDGYEDLPRWRRILEWVNDLTPARRRTFRLAAEIQAAELEKFQARYPELFGKENARG